MHAAIVIHIHSVLIIIIVTLLFDKKGFNKILVVEEA